MALKFSPKVKSFATEMVGSSALVKTERIPATKGRLCQGQGEGSSVHEVRSPSFFITKLTWGRAAN